jgi:Ohr subfamily peroxiredoxin
MKTLYTATVTARSGRDGAARSDDGLLDIPLAFPPALGGPGGAANPEQLFAAGFAACFASSVKASAQKLGVRLAGVEVQAAATLAVRDDGAFVIDELVLAVRAEGLAAQADAVLAEAERICAYTNSTRGNTRVRVQLA